MTKQTTIILGEEWEIIEGSVEEFPALEDCDGYTDSSIRQIVICDMQDSKEDESLANMEAYRRQVIRHEIIHAFLEESGISHNSEGVEHWAENEEMTDWFAIQAPKIFKVFIETDAI